MRDGKPLGIVHRDVSPHNVMLSAEGEVKLTDFGIAKAQNRKEKSLGNMIKGKISFMSPEQASGAPLDARSDLFSLGTMLYVMITRRLPFDAATDYETLMLVKSGDYLPPETARPGLNPELYRVIRKAMSKSESERYQKAEEMLVDVEQVMRLAFRAVGQTELQRWLSDLSTKDGVPPLTRETPPAPDTIVDVVGARPATVAKPLTGQESGLVLDLDDVVEVAPGSPPPRPRAAPAPYPNAGPTEPMLRPPGMMTADAPEPEPEPEPVESVLPWYRRRVGIVGGAVALVLVLVVRAKAFTTGRRHDAAASAPAAPTPATPTPTSTVPDAHADVDGARAHADARRAASGRAHAGAGRGERGDADALREAGRETRGGARRARARQARRRRPGARRRQGRRRQSGEQGSGEGRHGRRRGAASQAPQERAHDGRRHVQDGSGGRPRGDAQPRLRHDAATSEARAGDHVRPDLHEGRVRARVEEVRRADDEEGIADAARVAPEAARAQESGARARTRAPQGLVRALAASAKLNHPAHIVDVRARACRAVTEETSTPRVSVSNYRCRD